MNETMKKLYSTIMLLAMMVTALCLTACDDDDEKSESKLIGVWECVSTDYGEWGNYLEDETKVGDLIYFNADGTYKEVGHNNDSGRWSLSGNKLNMRSNDSYSVPATYTVTQLTTNQLSIVLSEEYVTFKLSFRKKQ